MSFLAEYVDPGLKVDLEKKPEEFELDEIRRIQDSAVAIMYALSMPRRLGGDATSEDLANDKKRCKRVLHVLKQSMQSWSSNTTVEWRAPVEDDRIRGASLDWNIWYEETRVHLMNLRAYIATYGMTKNGEWARKAVTRLTNELSWLAYAMR